MNTATWVSMEADSGAYPVPQRNITEAVSLLCETIDALSEYGEQWEPRPHQPFIRRKVYMLESIVAMLLED